MWGHPVSLDWFTFIVAWRTNVPPSKSMGRRKDGLPDRNTRVFSAVSGTLRTVIHHRRVRKTADLVDQLRHSCHKNCAGPIALLVHLGLEIKFGRGLGFSTQKPKRISPFSLRIIWLPKPISH